MARRPRTDWSVKRQLDEKAVEYAESHGLAYREPSEYHSQMSSGNVLLSMWTGSRKYYIEKADYRFTGVVERQGEAGYLPTKKKELFEFFDKLFYAVDLL